MADLLNINMNAGEVIAALDEYGDFSAGMTATEFVGEVNTAFPDADAELTDTASELVDKVNNAQPSPSSAIPEGTVLKFLHYSDPHSLVNATNKAKKMMSDPNDANYDPDIAFALLTGDNGLYKNENGQKVPNELCELLEDSDEFNHFMIMGNHDASDQYGRSSQGHANMVAAMTGYFMPNNVVTFGQNACYWYKDFFVGYEVDGLQKSIKVRVIGTDEYEDPGVSGWAYDALVSKAQVDWLIDRIDELGKDDYFIIATHQVPFSYNKNTNTPATANPVNQRRKNNFCCTNLSGYDGTTDHMDVFSDVVWAYKNKENFSKSYSRGLTISKDWSGANPATFLGFPCGHVHADIHEGIPKTGYEDLLMMCIDTSKNTWPSSSADFSANERRDADFININKVTVNFHDKTIRIDRIGCQQVDAMTVPATTIAGVEYPAKEYPSVMRDNIVFDFNANVIEEGERSDQ